MIKRFAIVLVLLALLGACSQPPDDGGGGGDLDPFYLDTYSTSGNPTATGPTLANGVKYILTVRGTHSSWTAAQWEDGVCEGEPEAAPTYASPAVTNGPVGMDAVWVFAVPNGSGRCGADMPLKESGITVSLDGRRSNYLSWMHEGTEPAADHVYEFEVTGRGMPIVMSRITGSPDNNYGRLRIEVSRVVAD
ncbi:MAG: hypothetical protein KF813_03845 [Trueperaceae bacterium]|nr:hypothetical protein [Trueperaceae bacterium]